jgi:hypothetical protein
VVRAATDMVGAAYDAVIEKMTTSVYQNNQPWQGACMQNCGGTFGTYGYTG